MDGKTIIRLEPNGPADSELLPLALESEDFQSNLPEQKWHIYYEDSKLGLTVGVWTTTTMQEAFGPYPGDEFMHILEGKVILLDGENNELSVNQSETFVVRNGIPISWKQEGFCRKFFMTYSAPDADVPNLETAAGGIKTLDENQLTEAFINDTGNMRVGTLETEAHETAMVSFPSYEFSQIVSGNIAITEEDGTVHHFSSGDCFFIPAGTVCSFKSDAKVRKFYCTLSPLNET